MYHQREIQLIAQEPWETQWTVAVCHQEALRALTSQRPLSVMSHLPKHSRQVRFSADRVHEVAQALDISQAQVVDTSRVQQADLQAEWAAKAHTNQWEAGASTSRTASLLQYNLPPWLNHQRCHLQDHPSPKQVLLHPQLPPSKQKHSTIRSQRRTITWWCEEGYDRYV